MSKKLLIVESPAKSKTIQKYVGDDYEILASYGHVRDLAKKNFGIDINNQFAPTYIIMPDKKPVVKALKDKAKVVDEVLIATDPDREGEAIAWHIIEALKLDHKKTKRVVFNEITKSAVLHAINNPRPINQNLVNAQQARRILDRIVGFELSPILWKKIKSGLSAGRVQSVALRLVVERDREITQFIPQPFYKVAGDFKTENNTQFQAEYKTRIETQKEAQTLLETIKNESFTVTEIEKKPSQRKPSPPFTTATLQQEAYRKLGYGVTQTMIVAQRLYEAGLITYMRTDSLSLSQDALSSISAYISTTYGAHYSETRQFKTKSKGAQEAHEAIRPTTIKANYNGSNGQEERLYELIKKRTLASQMATAKIDRTIVTLSATQNPVNFTAKGEVITFDGFLKVYRESYDDDTQTDNDQANTDSSQGLPKLTEKQAISYTTITATERFTRHLPRYSEASLVKTLEELGIGRPSTYAPTISTIIKRNYVEKRDLEGSNRSFNVITLSNNTLSTATDTEKTGYEKGKLVPTDIGKVVSDYLVDAFSSIMDYQFTATVEEKFDAIANGEINWQDMLDIFYKGFHPTIEKAEESKERVSGERNLGNDPDSGRPLIVRIGRYGPIAQIGTSEDEEKPKFASLLKTQSLETISLEDALELFKYPRQLGEFEKNPVEAAIGRFGPYLKHINKYYTLKDIPVDEVNLDQAIEIITIKRETDSKKLIKTIEEHDPPILIQNGPYGPYFKLGKKNFKVPADKDPKKLTLEDCLEIQKNPPKRYAKKTKTKTKAKKK
jgi:DNA topoisomerase-1